MGRVVVHAAELVDGRISRMRVALGALPARVIDRETAIRWMRDGHTFLPHAQGALGAALQLVEIESDDGTYARFIRDDHESTPADALPKLPAVG
jgi:hypothetical protein